MKIRLVEEYSPLKNERWYFCERKTFAGWIYISDTGSFSQDTARETFERIVKTGAWDKTRTVLAEAKLRPSAGSET